MQKIAHTFKNLPIRFKLSLTYTTAFIVITICSSAVIYALVHRVITANLENELTRTNLAVMNIVRATADASVKNYLRTGAERNRDIVAHIYHQYQAGLLTEAEAKAQAADLLLSQVIGETGYIYIINSAGTLEVHPKATLRGTNILEHNFAQRQIERKEGYLEYDWQNPDDDHPRAKALYMTYFAPWDWIISVSSYREEFTALVNISDVREHILSIEIGESGYPYILNSQGDAIIHPQLEGQNVYDAEDADGWKFVRVMCERKRGRIVYTWKNPDETAFREKLVIFDYIPEFDWIVAASSYTKEFYRPLIAIRYIIALVTVSILGLIIPLSLRMSTYITQPLKALQTCFAAGAQGDLTQRVTHLYQDEIGQVGRYFNTFIEKLEIAQRDLRTEIKDRQLAEDELQEKLLTIQIQQQAIQDLSTPVIPLMATSQGGIIVLPLIGSIDTQRAQDILRAVLRGISEHRASIVILDVTGVSVMDTGIINHLNKTIQAARLKGAHVIMTGISNAVAESIVDGDWSSHSIDWGAVETLADLQTGLQVALNKMAIVLKEA